MLPSLLLVHYKRAQMPAFPTPPSPFADIADSQFCFVFLSPPLLATLRTNSCKFCPPPSTKPLPQTCCDFRLSPPSFLFLLSPLVTSPCPGSRRARRAPWAWPWPPPGTGRPAARCASSGRPPGPGWRAGRAPPAATTEGLDETRGHRGKQESSCCVLSPLRACGAWDISLLRRLACWTPDTVNEESASGGADSPCRESQP